MKKISFILLAIILCHGIVNSQPANTPGLEIARQQFQAKQVIPPSPEAAELGKYGNIPISLFTGTPSVSIPLVELKGNSISIPVSLSYNSSGFKPEEIAPWTGLGWALNAGGVITRSAMGDPDMDNNYYKSPSPLDPVPNDEYKKQQYYEGIRTKQLETQPDVYYYNFLGQSGKFMIKPDSTIIKKEKSYLRIEFGVDHAAEPIFIITDEQGIVYEFKAMERTQINPVDDEPNAPPMIVRNFVSAWYLSKIIAPHGDEVVEFEYYSPEQAQSTQVGSLTNNSVTYTMTEYISEPGDPIGSNWQYQALTGSVNYFHNPATTIYKKFIKRITLKKSAVRIGFIDFGSEVNVRTDLGDADFDGERRLKDVKLYNVSNGDSSLIKHFIMGYGNFGASQAESPGYYRRLKLKTVREISIDSTITPSKPPYTFHYNGEDTEMPKRFTSGLDHWGFYNGQANTFSSQPTLVPTVNVVGMEHVSGNRGFGANREADAISAKLTVLEKIDYPTGGYTTFEYEGNSGTIFGSPPGNMPVGGLRIKQMIDHSFPDKPAIVKKYEYKNEDDNPSGQIGYYPYYYTTSTWYDDTYCPIPPEQTSKVVRTYNVTISASSSFGLGTIQGSHIGYTRVTEYQEDLATNKPLGKTVYSYDIQGFNEIDQHIGNGELLKQEVYDNGNKLLEEVSNTYTYEDYLSERVINRKLLSFTEQNTSNILWGKIIGSDTSYVYYSLGTCIDPPSGYGAMYIVPTKSYHIENYIHQQRKKIDQQVRKVFDPQTGSYLTYTKKFTYGNAAHNYPTLIREIDSKSDTVFTTIKYVADYTVSCPPLIPTPQAGSMAENILDMQAINIMGVPVEKLQYRLTPGGSRRYINGEFTQYFRGFPEKIYYLQATPPPSSVTESQASCDTAAQEIDHNYRLVATLGYDPYMNLQEENKIDDVVTTYFWGYDKRYPVAKVVGRTHTQSVAGSGINQSVLNNPSSEAALRTELNKLYNLPNAIVTTHTYQPMVGMISATDPRKQMLRYDYDKLNRLEHIRDSNDIIKNFRYNYGLGTAPTTSGQSLFYNAAVQDTFAKQGCPSGRFGEEIIYVVPYGKYGAVSQYKADSLALAEIAANGQNHANTVGRCYWKNAVKNQFIFKDNCPPEQGPPIAVLYNVPAGKYKSFVSQADADAMATADVATLGQVYANTNGTCSCVGEGKKWINGVCETGTQVSLGGHYVNGQWECVYYYEFSDATTSIYYYVTQPFPCPTGS